MSTLFRQKKLLLPIVYAFIFILAPALGLDGLFTIISAPVGLLLIGIYELSGIQITSIWLHFVISLIFAFLLGWAIDILMTKFRRSAE